MSLFFLTMSLTHKISFNEIRLRDKPRANQSTLFSFSFPSNFNSLFACFELIASTVVHIHQAACFSWLSRLRANRLKAEERTRVVVVIERKRNIRRFYN